MVKIASQKSGPATFSNQLSLNPTKCLFNFSHMRSPTTEKELLRTDQYNLIVHIAAYPIVKTFY